MEILQGSGSLSLKETEKCSREQKLKVATNKFAPAAASKTEKRVVLFGAW